MKWSNLSEGYHIGKVDPNEESPRFCPPARSRRDFDVVKGGSVHC